MSKLILVTEEFHLALLAENKRLTVERSNLQESVAALHGQLEGLEKDRAKLTQDLSLVQARRSAKLLNRDVEEAHSVLRYIHASAARILNNCGDCA